MVAGLYPTLAWDTPVAPSAVASASRCELASLLVGEWDVIARPTNPRHQASPGCADLRRRWAWPAAAILVVTRPLVPRRRSPPQHEVHDGIVEPFEGGYAAYVLQRIESGPADRRGRSKRQNLLRKELAPVAPRHTGADLQAQVPDRGANQLIAGACRHRATPWSWPKLAAARRKDVVITAGVSVSYQLQGRPVLRDIEWRIGPVNVSASSGLTAPASRPCWA